MKYPFFASFIVLCLLLMYEIHKRRNKEAKKYQEFWDEEAKANSTRRKNIDDLPYITIPDEILSLDLNINDQITEYQNLLRDLSTEKIVNFTGLTNTDLKLKYGAPNIDILSSFDQKYTVLARTLNDYAYALYDNGYKNEAALILEFAIKTKTDVSKSYTLLAKIYIENNKKEKIKELIDEASTINSLLKNSIIQKLNELLNN